MAFLDLLIDFYYLLIKKTSKTIDFNWKLIEIISPTIQFVGPHHRPLVGSPHPKQNERAKRWFYKKTNIQKLNITWCIPNGFSDSGI